MLPKNPDFCDLLLEKALERKYGKIVLEKLHDDYEREAHRVMEQRLQAK
jgi:CobQ-like glutamine amidotransferase family enzyme